MEILPQLENEYNLQLVEINNLNFSTFIHCIRDNSLVFNGLHGGEGENGQIQSFLSQHGIPYTGSGPMASMLAMNKHFTKILAIEKNILTPDWVSIKLDNVNLTIEQNKPENLSYPIVIKPNHQGSTLGLTIVSNKDDIHEAIKLASVYSDEIIIEKYINGREITVGILGNRVLDIVEIIPKSGFYNYKAKYNKGETEYICPADIDDKTTNFIKKQALKLYKSLGCRHYSRVDFILDNKNNPHLLEINTLPGLCSTSLLPISAKSKGLNFKNLLNLIIEIALIDNDIYL